MGIRNIYACHKCKQYVDLDKFSFWFMDGEALRFRFKRENENDQDLDLYYYDVDIDNLRYQLYYAHKLIKFLAIHDDCKEKIDWLKSNTNDDEHYYYVSTHYREIDFKNDDIEHRWDLVSERSQENIDLINKLILK